jgi:hypothetical protein
MRSNAQKLSSRLRPANRCRIRHVQRRTKPKRKRRLPNDRSTSRVNREHGKGRAIDTQHRYVTLFSADTSDDVYLRIVATPPRGRRKTKTRISGQRDGEHVCHNTIWRRECLKSSGFSACEMRCINLSSASSSLYPQVFHRPPRAVTRDVRTGAGTCTDLLGSLVQQSPLRRCRS